MAGDMKEMILGRLHILTDTVLQKRWSHAELAEQAIAGGAGVVQFRAKNLGLRAMIREAEAVVGVCRAAGVISIINDRVDVALAVGADGVHLGAADMAVDVARELLGPDAIIGATVRSGEGAVVAAQEGATYVGLGPVFGTDSKRVDHPALGLEGVSRAARLSPVPVIAIAGMTVATVRSVIAAGAYGVAVLGAVALAADPAAAARAFRTAIDSAGV